MSLDDDDADDAKRVHEYNGNRGLNPSQLSRLHEKELLYLKKFIMDKRLVGQPKKVRLKVNASNVIGQKDEEIRITGCRILLWVKTMQK